MTEVTAEPIVRIATGFMAAKKLFAANEVGLFERLADGPATLDELAQRVGIPCYTLRILADAMVALGLLERKADQYQNGPVAASFLSGRTPGDLGPWLRFMDVSYAQWINLAEATRSGRATFGGFTEEEQRVASAGIQANQAASAQALPTAYDFSPHRRVLDVGGGTGSWLTALLQHYTGLEATLFELPPVAAIARQRLASTPFTTRLAIVAGDVFADPIPDGHDAVILANVVHLFPPERNRELLRLIRHRVPDGARLLLVDYWTNPTHTEPLHAALMAGQFLIFGGGDVYSEEEARGWLQETGWRALERRPLVGPASLLVAETAD